MLLMTFAGVEPDWWCTSDDMNLSQWNRSHMSGSYRNCSWEGTCDRKFSHAMVTAVSEWNLVCDLSWVSNAIISIQMIGVLIGCIIAGHCADKYGRKIVFYSGLILLFLGNVVSAFSVSWTILMPESVRWLVVKGRLDDAKIVIQKIAELNKKPMPDTSILELIAQEEKAEGDKAKSYTYLDLFKTKDLGKKTIITCFLWLTCSGLYYVVVFGLKDLSGDFYLNLLLMTLTEFPVAPCVLLMSSINSDLMLPFIALGILVSLAGVATFGLEETSSKALEDTLQSSTRDTNEKGHLIQKGTSRESCDNGK
ncbi:organic cation transporter protein-like [Haliotis rubra]|uniref:organic cation transporter protein-like n=1 Tax=Haliotis rubra TaxID=36100 RepID=UPI001EE548BC|nr:organic cation transporter protein-like [Haliotis rubra]